MHLNIDEIKKFIPHRAPFLFIDSIESIRPSSPVELVENSLIAKNVKGTKVTAKFHVGKGLKILEGHFPGNPILPGVVQVEMMAQASCFAIYPHIKNPETFSLKVALLNISSAKFRKPITPGMDLVINSYCERVRGGMMSYKSSIVCNDELMSEASYLASVNID